MSVDISNIYYECDRTAIYIFRSLQGYVKKSFNDESPSIARPKLNKIARAILHCK